MPRLNTFFERTVFLLYGKDDSKDAPVGAVKGPKGSGVFIRAITDNPRVGHIYAVTAAHVVAGGASMIRINTDDGKHRLIDLDISEWTYDLAWEDLAISDVTERFRKEDLVGVFDVEELATKKFMRRVEFGIGEDGFMLGLFSGKRQGDRNEIAARFGNVSLLADDEAPIPRKLEKPPITITSPCHIFDMHSRPGFSGSPVFVYRTPEGDLHNLDSEATPRRAMMTKQIMGLYASRIPTTGSWLYNPPEEISLVSVGDEDNRFLRLLGIHVSQYHERVKIKKGRPKAVGEDADPVVEDDDILRNDDMIRFPGSMTIVVPADRIVELLGDKELTRQRQERAEKIANAPETEADMAEPETAASVEPETDNPSAKEDFTSLLNAAARSNKPAS